VGQGGSTWREMLAGGAGMATFMVKPTQIQSSKPSKAGAQA
jgi:hypothetical protein